MTREDGAALNAEDEDLVLWTAGALYAAGADTVLGATNHHIMHRIEQCTDCRLDGRVSLQHDDTPSDTATRPRGNRPIRSYGASTARHQGQGSAAVFGTNPEGDAEVKIDTHASYRTYPGLIYSSRWGAPSPMGISHATARDDEYHGYHIPAKTPVLANIWAMMHDENEYPNPLLFDPERFSASENQRDPRELVFGFGRRGV